MPGKQNPQGHVLTRVPDQDQSQDGLLFCVACPPYKPPCSAHAVGVSAFPPGLPVPHPGPRPGDSPLLSILVRSPCRQPLAVSQPPWPWALAVLTVCMATRVFPVGSGDSLSLLKYVLRRSLSLGAWREWGSREQHPMVVSLFLSSLTFVKSPLLLLLIRDESHTTEFVVWREDNYLALLPN